MMETELTPEQVRAYADKVLFGECITFPNGLVIDKRPLAYPTPVPYTPASPVPTYPPGMTW